MSAREAWLQTEQRLFILDAVFGFRFTVFGKRTGGKVIREGGKRPARVGKMSIDCTDVAIGKMN